MNRRAVLGLVGCGVGTVATGRTVSLAACDATVDSGTGPAPRWVFPAGDYRIGIESHADRSARLIVFATATEPERSFVLPPPPKEHRKPVWVPVEATADEPAQAVTIETAPPGMPDVATTAPPSDASEARIVFDQEPGVTTYVDCCGVGVAGRAYAVASVSGTGPTYLVRLDPAAGALATLAISRRALRVVALYRRPGENALCVVVADGKDVIVRGALV